MATIAYLSEHKAAQASARVAIRLDGVEKRIGSGSHAVTALSRTSLTVAPGEIIALVGPTGCAKSMLLRLIGGMAEPSAGRIEIAGRPFWTDGVRDSAAMRRIGTAFQEDRLLPWLSIGDNIALPLELAGVPAAERAARMEQLTTLVGIPGATRAHPADVGPETRLRAGLARALARDPEILLLDEPFGSLDDMRREQCMLDVQRIAAELGAAMVVVTHSIIEAVLLADRVVVMAARPGRIGQIVEVPMPRPRHPTLQSVPEFQELALEIRHAMDPA